MEACGMVNYRRRNKADRNDSDVMQEAARCGGGGILPVPVKSNECQQVRQHDGLRETWKKGCTRCINLLRGVRYEAGIAAPASVVAFLRGAYELVDRAELTLLRPQLYIFLAADQICMSNVWLSMNNSSSAGTPTIAWYAGWMK